ncbi:FIG01199342: hypothetical protein [uncultured Candidatus Thioglobus sp.]|nr:FIG01199342: hypothetical protein [uncultured Candidatus Thioglobus sp.]
MNEEFETSCGTNSEPFALQNLGSYMEPEFSENCILIIDPGMRVHHRAYAVVRYENELYFRQYIERGNHKFLIPLNTQHNEIELKGEFETVGCVIQQKQRKQTALHYYHLNKETKQLDFSISGKPKDKES